MSESYWALSENIGDEIVKQRDIYERYCRMSGRLTLWMNAHKAAYQAEFTDGELIALGENGEFTGVYVNEYRSLADSKLNMILAQKPAFQCRAVNTDYKSMAQTKLGNGLLEYYFKQKNLEDIVSNVVDGALKIYGEFFLVAEWDSAKGDEFAVSENDEIVKNGDLAFRLLSPALVARDSMARSNEELSWYITTRFENKYELAAKYPDKKDEIEKLTYDNMNEFYAIGRMSLTSIAITDTDLIPIHTLYHKPTLAVPNGRMVEYIDGVVLIDTPLPYRQIPIYRMAGTKRTDTIFGYTEFWDLLGMQKILNMLHSTAATNQSTWGVSSVLIPRGANVEKTDLGGGLKILQHNGDLKPEAFNLLNTSPEVYNYMSILSQVMEKQVSIPATRRGAPEASLKSGAALALVTSQALENSATLQKSYVQLLENLALGIINILQDFANVPRIAMIVGKSNREYMKEFVGEDLGSINRVMVDIGNPMTSTIAGRVELAENYMKLPPEFRDQWITIVTTGRTEPMVDGDSSELLLVQSENEAMMDNGDVIALITDNHIAHNKGHATLLSSPEARKNPELVKLVLGHMMEHIKLAESGNPLLYIDQPQQPPLMPPQGMPEQMNGANPIETEGANVDMPQMPINPLTNEQGV